VRPLPDGHGYFVKHRFDEAAENCSCLFKIIQAFPTHTALSRPCYAHMGGSTTARDRHRADVTSLVVDDLIRYQTALGSFSQAMIHHSLADVSRGQGM